MEEAERADGLSEVRREEERVEERSAVFRKELGLTDLVLTQIVFVVGTIWVGTAAKLGNEQLFFWLLAIVTFYLPLAAVVIYLNRLMPLEGGLYQWAKLGFNEFVGYMVAWNLWVFAILVMSGIGLLVVTNLSYAFGGRWMAESKWFVTLSCEAEPVALPAVDSAVGIDVGLASFATMSDGSEIENPRFYRNDEKDLKRVQRLLSKEAKGTPGRRRRRNASSSVSTAPTLRARGRAEASALAPEQVPVSPSTWQPVGRPAMSRSTQKPFCSSTSVKYCEVSNS